MDAGERVAIVVQNTVGMRPNTMNLKNTLKGLLPDLPVNSDFKLYPSNSKEEREFMSSRLMMGPVN